VSGKGLEKVSPRGKVYVSDEGIGSSIFSTIYFFTKKNVIKRSINQTSTADAKYAKLPVCNQK